MAKPCPHCAGPGSLYATYAVRQTFTAFVDDEGRLQISEDLGVDPDYADLVKVECKDCGKEIEIRR